MINVQINEDEAINMLLERCNAWGTSQKNIDLFEKMYENYVYNGVFDGGEFDVMKIVDNDVVNYCDVICEDDEDFEKLLKLADDREYDVSCENFENGKYSYIEAVSDDRDRILIRW